ncbi:MAG: hypothetical protein R2860_04590 [Desulfobacterales bacterium]
MEMLAQAGFEQVDVLEMACMIGLIFIIVQEKTGIKVKMKKWVQEN